MGGGGGPSSFHVDATAGTNKCLGNAGHADRYFELFTAPVAAPSTHNTHNQNGTRPHVVSLPTSCYLFSGGDFPCSRSLYGFRKRCGRNTYTNNARTTTTDRTK